MLLAALAPVPGLAPTNPDLQHVMAVEAIDAAGEPCQALDPECRAGKHCNPALTPLQKEAAVTRSREPVVTFRGSFAEFTAGPDCRPPLVVAA